MEIKVYETYEEMSLKCAERIAEVVKKDKNAVLSFPSGDTPLGTFRCLEEMSRAGSLNFSHCKFIGLDEWVGMGKEDEGSCKNFI